MGIEMEMQMEMGCRGQDGRGKNSPWEARPWCGPEPEPDSHGSAETHTQLCHGITNYGVLARGSG